MQSSPPPDAASAPLGGTAQAKRWAPAPPFEVGRYRLEQELALGAYGATFSGVDTVTHAPVHVTLFHPAFFAEPRRRAQRERIERAVQYRSGHVAPTMAVGEAHGTIWAATAPIVGVPLTHWRRDAGALKPDDIYRLIGQMLDAMSAIHAVGGVHGSLSPETLRVIQGEAWITSPWWLEPADVPVGEVQPQRTAWMAPELMFGELAESPATDVYGIGLALGYLLACGMTEPGHSLLVQGIDVPPAVDDVYVRATARQKGSRYADVASFRAALEAAAGFEWRDAQKTLRKGTGTGLVGLEVLEAGPARPRTGPSTRQSGLVSVAPAMPTPPSLPVEPPTVPTASVVQAIAERSAIHSEVERTSEDAIIPAFEAFDLDGGGPPPMSLDLTDARRPPEPPAPLGRRANRVPSRTLPHGSPRMASGLASVLEVDFRRADPLDAPRSNTAPRMVAPPPVDATDALPAAAIPEDVLRALMQPPDLGAPPPLPGQTRPRFSTSSSAWGSSLEALDDGPIRAAEAVEVKGPPAFVPPPLPPPGPISKTSARPTMIGMPAFAPPAVSEAPPALDVSTDPDDYVIGPHDSIVGMGEPTVVEAIAPSLLEVDVFTPHTPLPPQVDLFAPEAPAPLDPWSDSPLVTRNEGSSASLRVDVVGAPPLPPELSMPVEKPRTTKTRMRPVVTTAGPAGASPAVESALDKPIARAEALDSAAPGRTTGSSTRPQMARVSVHTPLADEPRVLRDPSGPLSGGAATLSGLPIRGDSPMMRTDGSMVATLPKKSNRTLWYALAAVVVGAVVTFFLLSSNGNKIPNGGEMVAAGGQGAGIGGDPSGPAGGVVVPVASTDVRDAAPEAAPPEPPEMAPEVVDTSAAPDTSLSALALPGEPDVVAEASDTTLVDSVASTVADTFVPETTAPETVAETSVPETVAETTAPEIVAPDAIAPSTFTPKDPNKLRCPDGMSKLKKKVPVTLADGKTVDDWEVTCIDRFEFPGAGAPPRTGVDLSGARAACIGKGKRLCTRSEWRRACGGTYPYGKDYDADKCNTAGADGSPKGLVAAGSKRGCMSPSGAFDMVGNAAEWTSDGTVNGGTSLKNGEDATCGSGSRRAGGAPHIGFRCCADGKE